MPATPRLLPDPDATTAGIAEQYLPRLRVFAVRRLRDMAAAEDAAQETLRRVLEALREGRVRDLQALPAYVFETARHVCLHAIRDSNREAIAHAQFAALASQMATRGPNPLDTLLADERQRLAGRALSELDPLDRELIELSYGQLLSADEIASRLGLSANNVRVKRHRILRRIAVKLRVTEASSGALEE
jgi:RNA polymerase sigma-70 factor, ECF subfamily